MLPIFKQDGWVSSTGTNYLGITIGFLVLEQGLEFYLLHRQRKYLRKDAAPVELLDEAKEVDSTQKNEKPSFVGTIMSKFSKAKEYNLDRNKFSLFSGAYEAILSIGSLVVGLSPLTFSAAYSISKVITSTPNEYLVSGFALLISSILETMTSLPVSYYSTFVVEQKHGFNKTTQWTFWTDLLKNFLIGNVISIPLMLGIVKLVQFGGQYFYLYVWFFIFLFSLAMLSIYPTLIMPLFNKYTPLEDSTLKTKINQLAAQLEFPLTKIYEVDGSKRSSHSNAYLFGFFKDKRIVLFDTLFKKSDKVPKDSENDLDLTCTDEEVVGILAHELGHWKLSHTLKGFVLQQFITLSMMRLFGEFMNNTDLYNSFGFTPMKFNDGSRYPVVVGLSLFMLLLSPVGSALGLATNSLTRKYEYEADAFAVSLGKTAELRSGLLKISIGNLSSFEVDPWFHMFHHSHPTLLQRLTRMKELDQENKKTK